MGNEAIIGYETVATISNISATTQGAGFPATNLVSQLTTHLWQPTALPATVTVNIGSATTVEYMGIAAHDLATQECNIEFYYWTGSVWTSITTKTPIDNKAIMITTSQSATQYKAVITRNSGATATAMPAIGVFMLGETLTMQRRLYGGHTPVTLARNTKKVVNETEGGQFAGNSIVSEGVSTDYEWKNLTAAWVRSTFDPFIVNSRAKPFFIMWRPDDYPNEVGFVWTTADIKPVNMGVRDLMSVSMSVKGYSDE